MENSLLVGLSRQMSLRRELEVVANNIANINTTGFKGDGALFSEYLSSGARAEQFQGSDQRISFVEDRATWHDMSAGQIRHTGSPLDVAIDGDAFLTVQTAQGERYTRNGALQINAQGQLVTSAGDLVLGDGGPIQFQPSDREINIDESGSISVREGTLNNTSSTRGKLRLVRFDQPQRLQKQGSSLYSAPQGMRPAAATETVRVLQGSLEQSNVNAVLEMARMIEITRSYTQVANMLQQQSDMRQSAIQRLAEVPA